MNDLQFSRERSEGESGGGFLSHIPAILWQRRWFVLVPAVLLSIAGIAAALLWPTMYRSTAVLLVESQELPKDLVGSPVTSFVDQRIARIQQQVLSRGDLIELIQQNNLYEEERRNKPISSIVDRMRSAARVQAVDAAAPSGGNASKTIAFSMSFDYPEPAKAQLVMQSFVNSFLEMDASQMEKQATGTVDFLTTQASELQRQIADLEGRITSVKARNGSALAGTGFATAATPGSYDAQIAALQRENMLARQRAQRGAAKDPSVLSAEADVANARAVYTDNHPDVIRAEQRLAEARRLAAANSGDTAAADAAAVIAANNAQIAALGRARAADLSQSASALAAQSAAPAIMEQVSQLESRASILRAQYQDVSTRLLAARASARMENEDKGERLAVADPPSFPDKPLDVNRPLLALGGVFAGLFGGLVLAMLVEFVQKPIRGVAAIEQMLGVPPLVVVPTLKANVPAGSRAGGLFGLFSRRAGRSSGA